MAYTGKMRCRRCQREFNYFCLPYGNEVEEPDKLDFNNFSAEAQEPAQMCLDWVSDNDIPIYSAYCPECGCENSLPESDAINIPKVYFDGFLPKSE